MSEGLHLAQMRLSQQQLTEVRDRVQAQGVKEHYPVPADRLFSSHPGVAIDRVNRRLVLPRDGLWNVSGDVHPNRVNAPAHLRHTLHPEVPSAQQDQLSEEEAHRWAELGYWLDDRNLPVTEAAVQMLEDPDIGVLTGLASFWYRGVNATSDLAVVRKHGYNPDELLLVVRNDNRKLALPGGYVDPGESGAHAAWRETLEETGLRVGNPEDYRRLSADLSIGAGATAHAMAGNELFLVQGCSNEYLYETELQPDPNEVAGADWYTLAQIEEMKDSLFSHHLGHVALIAKRLSR